jgi:hypothetical protein
VWPVGQTRDLRLWQALVEGVRLRTVRTNEKRLCGDARKGAGPWLNQGIARRSADADNW